MKYVIVLGDGMSGLPLQELGGRTTLEAAHTPVMDELAGKGELGLVQNVPEGMEPGSDVANLSVLGCDPRQCYTGRAPLEALSLGLSMAPGEWALRCNLVTVSEGAPLEQAVLLDHSAGEISTEESHVLIRDLSRELPQLRLYAGTGYRHICLWDEGQPSRLYPPHDHVGQQIGGLLPEEEKLRQAMEVSYQILQEHPVNRKRAERGLRKANALWFWGAGTKPELADFYRRTGKRGMMISAVDLLKGIAKGMGMEAPKIPGADGTLHTNYEGKAQAALRALLEQGADLAYVHLEAPDEMSHQGRVADKIRAIEALDDRIIAPIRAGLEQAGQPHRILILPDHANPVALRHHTSDPVPYLLYDSTRQRRGIGRYSESEARDAGNFLPQGWKMMDHLLERE